MYVSLAGAIAVAMLVGLFAPGHIVHVFTLDSISMQPTLDPGDVVLVNRLASPDRGELVVFRDPGGWVRDSDGGAYLVKRVIGLPGDRVSCCPSGVLVVNGDELPEAYLFDTEAVSELGFDVTVAPGAYWVMGDHRSDSRDSRSDPLGEHAGAVDEDLVVGVVRLAWGAQGLRRY